MFYIMILKLVNMLAASIINSMDQSVDPCDDFYQFACGNYLENTFLNYDEWERSRFSVMAKIIRNKLHMIVAEPIQPDELRPFKMLKTFFKSCMDLGIMIYKL